MGKIIAFIFGIFLVAFLITIILSEFPMLQPLFEEGKTWVSAVWDYSVAKYGIIAAGILVIGLAFLASGKK